MEYSYLMRKKSPVAHLWDGLDTLCRMWSTGGMGGMSKGKKKFQVSKDHGGRRICTMCANVLGRTGGAA
jgi:hypothetical protein